MAAELHGLLDRATGLPGQFRGLLGGMVDRAVTLARDVAADPAREAEARQATNALYHALSAVLLAHDGIVMAKETGDARRLLLARLVVDQRLSPQDPLNPGQSAFSRRAEALLLDEAPVPIAAALDALVA